MNISQLITPSRVVSDLSGTTKIEVLTTLAEVFARDLSPTSGQEILDILMEREKIGSTGIGNGIAVPHGRLAKLSAPIAIMGRSSQGVMFDALDGKPVYLIIALLSPVSSSKLHLAALSTISQLLHRRTVCDHLRAASDQEAVFSVLTSGDET